MSNHLPLQPGRRYLTRSGHEVQLTTIRVIDDSGINGFFTDDFSRFAFWDVSSGGFASKTVDHPFTLVSISDREDASEHRSDVDMTRHLMVDLETLSTSPLPAIVQVGAVVFTEDGEIHARLNRRVGILSSLHAGGIVSSDTLKFWREQSREVVDGLSTGEHVTLGEALGDVEDLYKRSSCSRVWSHGLASDVCWLANSYGVSGTEPPWDHRAPRDTRTLFEVAEENGWVKTTPTVGGPEHDALHDAEVQALQVVDALKFLKGERR